MTVFFTSDTHFFHKNICRYSGRPFDSVEDMNEALIERWNTCVGRADLVYHLGDVAFAKASVVEPLLNRLNGKIILIPGNHDSADVQKLSRWEDVQKLMEVSINGKHITLCHYRMMVWNKSHHGSLHLHGHSHSGTGGKPHPIGTGIPPTNQCLDVGVDCWDYYPVTLTEIMERMATYPSFRSKDHHENV